VVDLSRFSKKVRDNPLAKSRAGLQRLIIGMQRIQSVLEREQVAAIRTLEMKISDAGRTPLRVEPHILGLAGLELVERGFVKIHHHPDSGTHNWYAPARLDPKTVKEKLDELLPVYQRTTDPSFTGGLGDPLEISVFKILKTLREHDRRLTFFGSFDLSARTSSGRFAKTEPPTAVNASTLHGPPDFTLFHGQTGEAALIECKNIREWIYPSSSEMKDFIRKALMGDMTPIFIARRLPYITKTALCAPAGIIAHETYNQLYPETDDGKELASKVRLTRGLGYADVRASEDPLPRTVEFFETNLPILLPIAASRFQANRGMLQKWVDSKITWTQLRLHLAADYKGPDADMSF
jgi:hypothetical protein